MIHILLQCRDFDLLGPLLSYVPYKLAKPIMEVFSHRLPHDSALRRDFVQNGGLKTTVEMEDLADDAETKGRGFIDWYIF